MCLRRVKVSLTGRIGVMWNEWEACKEDLPYFTRVGQRHIKEKKKEGWGYCYCRAIGNR